MVGECSICPIDWAGYYGNVEKALKIIWDSGLDDVLKERLEDLLRVTNCKQKFSQNPPKFN